MKYYCPNCKKECETEVVEQDETLNVKGKEITLKVKMRICKECGEGIIDKDLDNASLKAFYDEYEKDFVPMKAFIEQEIPRAVEPLTWEEVFAEFKNK